MHHHYTDIRSRIPEEPKWFDENAVPRYSEFTPDETADIYCRQVALLEIACQSCGHRFLVAMSWNEYRRHISLEDRIQDGSIHYGDPPNIECCPAGPTMNCIDVRVVEFWKKEHPQYEWVRDTSLEVPLEDVDEYFDDNTEGFFQVHDGD